MCVAGLAGREEARVAAIGGDELFNQVGADLVVRLADHRPGGRDDAAARGAELFHRRDRASSTPSSAPRQPACAAPITRACASANSTGPQSAVEMPMASAGTRVTMASARGRVVLGPRRLRDHDVGRMDLVGGEEALRRDRERRRHARAVLRDMGRRVVRAGAAVEARIDAVGHAAVAREEGVADAGEGGQRGSVQRSGAHVGTSHGSNPGSVPSRGSPIAIALNNVPMPVRPAPVRRATATSTSVALSRVTWALSASARCSRPRLMQESRLRDRAVHAARPCSRRQARAPGSRHAR